MSMLLRYIIQIIGSLVFMFTLSPKLTGVLISVVPVVGIGAQQYGLYSGFSLSLHMHLFHRLLKKIIKNLCDDMYFKCTSGDVSSIVTIVPCDLSHAVPAMLFR